VKRHIVNDKQQKSIACKQTRNTGWMIQSPIILLVRQSKQDKTA
jgi:hypothetical protein